MMPATATSLPVTGTFAAANPEILVLSTKLEGHDTFLTGAVDVGDGIQRPVRILTLDDVTVLRLTGGAHSRTCGGGWTGTLHLPHGQRPRMIPADVAAAAGNQRRDLTVLDDAELRYALTFLNEATSEQIRIARINAILAALPTSEVRR